MFHKKRNQRINKIDSVNIRAFFLFSLCLLVTLYSPPLIHAGTINGVVWEDTNENGMRDLGEIPIAGVSLSLVPDNYNYARITDASGRYSINDIFGISRVYLIWSSLPTISTYWVVSPQNQGSDPSIDCDFDASGVSPSVRFWDETLYGSVSFDLGIHPYSPSPVPEPATIMLLGTGLIGLAGFRKKFWK